MKAYRRLITTAVTLMVTQIGCRYADVTPQSPAFIPTQLDSQPTGQPLSNNAAFSVQMAVARSLEKQGKTRRAITAYRKLAVTYDVPQAHHRLGVLYEHSGQFEDAERSYQRALEQDPHNAQILCDVGYSRYLRKQWNQSEQYLRRAIELKPDLERAHNNLGLLLARQGRRDEALEAFSRAGTNVADAHSNLAYALLAEKRTDVAGRHAQLALQAEKDHQIAKNLMTVIRRAELTQDLPGKQTSEIEDPISGHERHVHVTSAVTPPNPLPSDQDILTTDISAVRPAAYKEGEERPTRRSKVEPMHRVDMRAFRAPDTLRPLPRRSETNAINPDSRPAPRADRLGSVAPEE